MTSIGSNAVWRRRLIEQDRWPSLSWTRQRESSEEDLVVLCQTGYEEFECVPTGWTVGMNGEGKSRGQPANPGLPGKWPSKRWKRASLHVRICVISITRKQWLCGRLPDLQSEGCRFESRTGLLRTKVYSVFYPSGVGKWVPAIAGKAKAGMVHSDCGWTCGCAGKNCEIPWEHVPYPSTSAVVIHY